VEKLHNGYFAQDKKGVLKDTRGDTQADDEVYNLIMKEKERLLSFEEPLRFVFSHSALREGWDNPNVFQICTLNETRSAIKKRQEIGRGLRLPVDQDGRRVFDDSINRLYVMANESYEDFARSLHLVVETPLGPYNPDWAIVKEDHETLYLVRETKGTRDFLKLRTSEADKVRCGEKHFQALGVSFGVAVTASDV
jgi:type III restriction enzyme